MNSFSTASSFAEPALLPQHLQRINSSADKGFFQLNICSGGRANGLH
jgi:hypothetical protein